MTIRRGLVVGRGGTLGFAWSAVALREVERALDWDVRGSDVLVRNSAGSEMEAAIGSGRTPQDLLDALDGAPNADPLFAQHAGRHPGMLPPRPAAALPGLGLMGPRLRRRSLHTGLLSRGRGDATWLRELGDALAGGRDWVGHPATWIVAADIATGERVAFGAPGGPPARLGDALAASWAIPGWFPPVEIGGRRYVDGGAVSTALADLLLDRSLDEVIVVAPMATAGGAPARGFERVDGLLCSQMTRTLDREIAELKAADVTVIHIEPQNAELAAKGPNFMDLTRCGATITAARRHLPEGVTAAVTSAR